jgi:hypothetical protein
LAPLSSNANIMIGKRRYSIARNRIIQKEQFLSSKRDGRDGVAEAGRRSRLKSAYGRHRKRNSRVRTSAEAER